MEQDFELKIGETTYKLKLDKHGFIWLKDSNETASNFGQTRPANSIEEAKEMAKLMLFAMGRNKRN